MTTGAPTAPTKRDDAGGQARRAPSRSWRPAKIHRVADLSPRSQVAFAAVLVALALIPILSALIVLQQGWRPSGDNALIGLRARDVLTGHVPLIGQPSTGENFGSGVASSHPGPIEFYLIAPFVAVLGPVIGLALGAAVINSAGLVAIGWYAMRRGGMALLLIASLGAALLGRSLGGNFLHDPVSSNVGAICALALFFAAWSIIAGDIRTLPGFVLLGTFTLQDHLTYLGTGAPLVLVAIGTGIWWIRRTLQRASDTSWVRPRLILSAVIAVVLWLPVALDQLFGTHNISAIVETFTSGKTADPASKGPEGVGFAAKRLAEALAPWPIFSRRLEGPIGWLHTPATHEVLTGYLVLIAVVVLGVVFYRRRRTDLAAMSAVVVLIAATGFSTAMKLPGGAGVKASNLRWMWTVSAFTWIALAWLIWNLLPDSWKEVITVPALIVGSCALVLSLASILSSVDLATDRDGAMAVDVTSLMSDVKRDLPEGRYRVKYAGGSVVLSVGPALVHDLDDRGDQLYLDIGPFNRAYGDHRTYDDQEDDGTILITAEASGEYAPGTRLLGRKTIRVNPTDKDLTTIRVYLTEGAE